MKKKTSLACSECGSRNYTVSASGSNKQVRLEVRKFCRHCNKHTLHRETK